VDRGGDRDLLRRDPRIRVGSARAALTRALRARALQRCRAGACALRPRRCTRRDTAARVVLCSESAAADFSGRKGAAWTCFRSPTSICTRIPATLFRAEGTTHTNGLTVAARIPPRRTWGCSSQRAATSKVPLLPAPELKPDTYS
jgi:hypothetical protein